MSFKRKLNLSRSLNSSWRSRYNSSECSDILPPARNYKTVFPQELSDQLRAVRRTVFILTSERSPCYIEKFIQPHLKLLVAGKLDLALHSNTRDRHKIENEALSHLIASLLGTEVPEADLYTTSLMGGDITMTDVYDTLFRWMGETKVLIETVHPKDIADVERLERLHSNFMDGRFIWETSDPRCCKSDEELADWYSCHSAIMKFLSGKYKHTWVHVKSCDVIVNSKDTSENVTECIGVFVSRHYDKMQKSLSKFISHEPLPPINTELHITDERILKLASDLGYEI